jgi:hypothetical protein
MKNILLSAAVIAATLSTASADWWTPKGDVANGAAVVAVGTAAYSGLARKAINTASAGVRTTWTNFREQKPAVQALEVGAAALSIAATLGWVANKKAF